MSTKSQIKIGETIGVLIVVYIGLLIGLNYFTNSIKTSSKTFEEEIIQDQTFNNFNYILNHPVLKYQIDGQTRNGLTLNSINLEVFKNHIQANEIFYYEKLGPCKIQIKLYDYNINDFKYINFKNITVFDRTLPNKKEKRIFYNFINVRNTLKHKTYMGIMQVEIPY